MSGIMTDGRSPQEDSPQVDYGRYHWRGRNSPTYRPQG
jgi:hypothetical protein